MHDILGWVPLRWLVLLHVLAAFAFVLLHGPSAYAMARLLREREPARVAALLDMSGAATPASWAALAFLGLTGLLLASMEHVWSLPWAWGSVVVLLVASFSMSWLAARPFNHARGALGLRWFDGRRQQPATGVVDLAAFEAALAMVRARTPATLVLGTLGLVALVWLMVARPA